MREFMDFAAGLAEESGHGILHWFRAGTEVHYKADQTPVTQADREAEHLMRRRIEKAYPSHRILGEEAGMSGGGDGQPQEKGYQWVLDPIDGTKAFIHGVPLFGTLIALLKDGLPVLGVIHLPALGQLLMGARGEPTTLNGTPVRVSTVARLEEAAVLMTSPATLFEQGWGEGFHRLRGRARLMRGWGDCYGHFLVATGKAEVMLDPVLNLWDIAPMGPILEGAGGVITDMTGRPGGMGNSGLSTNGLLHREVLEVLGKNSPSKQTG
ncbi:MAG: histidinol-phosphatase [Deltaproteobacteria bacterium]|nr:histidinol-phosphatase [Deltaproteobacteria bacterium]